jgi:hypothetical protein
MRRSYEFDDDAFVECKEYTFYPHKSGKWFYLVGGANDGCRVLVEIGEPNPSTGVRPLGVGRGLHAAQTVEYHWAELSRRVLRALQRAADSTVNPQPLLDIDEVPGFSWRFGLDAASFGNQSQYAWNDIGGWYTRSRFSIQLAAPAWAPDAQAYDLREGVYLVFADGTTRLVRKREYYSPEYGELLPVGGRVPDLRQGDLLLYEQGRPEETQEAAERYDRHSVTGKRAVHFPALWMDPQIEHPEHDRLSAEGAFMVVFAPGTSVPFAREGANLD